MTRSHYAIALRKITPPLLISVAVSLVFFFAGDAYQAVGLAALDTSQRVASYVLGIALFLSVAVLVERVTRYIILDTLVATALGGPVPRLLSQISGILIYLVAFGAILAVIFKQDLTVLWAASGVAGIVLGMALRELLLDIFCGLAMNIDRPVKIGDYVQLHRAGDTTVEGKILEISWRTTRIQDMSANIIIMPNNRLSSSTITNFSQPKNFQESSVVVSMDVTVPHERAMRILLAAATEAAAFFMEDGVPPPAVSIRAITAQGVEYIIVYSCELTLRNRARNLILQHVLRHLRQAGLRPALPKVEQSAPETLTWQTDLPTAAQMLHILGGAEPFLDLSPAELAFLAGRVRFRVEPADRTVVQAGETGGAVFVVVEGLLQARKGRGGDPAQGEALLRPGDIFGTTAALLGEAHPVTVRSRTSAMLCEVDIRAFQDLFVGHPGTLTKVSLRIAGMMAREIARTKKGGSATIVLDDLAADVVRSMRRTFSDVAVP